MVDRITPEKRSWNMSRIRSSNTKPEIAVRSALHQSGFRFTVNGPLNKKLPGKPDIVLPRYRTIIFVHGCFWHGHENCKISRIPKTRSSFLLPRWQKPITLRRTEYRSNGWLTFRNTCFQLKFVQKLLIIFWFFSTNQQF